MHEIGYTKFEVCFIENAIILHWESQSHMKRLLHNCVVTRSWAVRFHSTVVLLGTVSSSAVKMETVCFSETFVFTEESTLRHYTEQEHLSPSRPWKPVISPVCWSARNCSRDETYCKKPISLCLCVWLALYKNQFPFSWNMNIHRLRMDLSSIIWGQ
jgi:hypothetical protein